MTLNVIDVSRYQAGINLPAMKNAGCDAVIVGATFGTAGINPAAFAQLDGTKAAGMLRGVYHIRARQDTTAIQEANYFLNNIRGYLDGSTLPVLDWEECDTSDEAWALAWLNEVYRQTGIRPWFYVNLADLLKYKYPRIAAAGYAVWLASYPYNTVDGFQGVGWTPQAIPAGHTLAAWQYVGTGGSLAGYQGLDLSVAYLTAKGWNAYARPQLTPDAASVTPIQEPDMPLTATDLQAVARAVWGYRNSASNDPCDMHQAVLNAAATTPATVWAYQNPASGDTGDMHQYLVDAAKPSVASLTDAQVTTLADQLRATLPAATVQALAQKLA